MKVKTLFCLFTKKKIKKNMAANSSNEEKEMELLASQLPDSELATIIKEAKVWQAVSCNAAVFA